MRLISTALALLITMSSAPSLVKADDDSDEYTVWVTPHEQYSSSVGVLGCKIDTDRVAYWPNAVDCDKICVSLSYEGRTVKLLRIDQSQGAHDVSYDAWNYLYTGKSALDEPTAGGAVEMQARNLDASECEGLINTDGNKLPLSASNSMNFVASCLGDGSEEEDDDSNSTWVGQNFQLYNVADPICSLGHDEECELDWPAANQAECPSGLGDMPRLEDAPVYNIRYPSGEKVLASTGEVVDNDGGPSFRAPADWRLRWLTLTAASVTVRVLWGP